MIPPLLNKSIYDNLPLRKRQDHKEERTENGQCLFCGVREVKTVMLQGL